MSDFIRRTVKNRYWADVCDKCENRLQKAINDCLDLGCHRFKVERRSHKEIHRAVLCWKCDRWVTVDTTVGFCCSNCGIDCRFASMVETKRRTSKSKKKLDENFPSGIIFAEDDDE